MSLLETEPRDRVPPILVHLSGGSDAPLRARQAVLGQLAGQLSHAAADDLALVISELVTNSVRHAGVGPAQTLSVVCTSLADHLRLTVTDPGCRQQPHLRALGDPGQGGYGLRVVASLSREWGVVHDPAGPTSVWCELRR